MQKIVFTTVETHTLGRSTRIITSGFPDMPGITMMEEEETLEQRYDHLRHALMYGPRGCKDMVEVLILLTRHTASAFGTVFMDAKRWVNIYRYASIGCAMYTMEVELVPVCEPYTEVVMDTPSGTVYISIRVRNKKAQEVALHNVPSFLFVDEVKVKVDSKKYRVAISLGGVFFTLFGAAQPSLQLDAKDIKFLVPFTRKLLAQLNKQYEIKHPSFAVTHVVDAKCYVTTGERKQKSTATAEEGQISRSSCRTEASAKLAYLYVKGNSSANEIFMDENFTGAKFYERYEVEDVVEHYRGIQPMTTSSAYITGKAVYVVDEDDPLTCGFTIWVYFCIMVYKEIQRVFEFCWPSILLLTLSFYFIYTLADEGIRKTRFLFMRETGSFWPEVFFVLIEHSLATWGSIPFPCIATSSRVL